MKIASKRRLLSLWSCPHQELILHIPYPVWTFQARFKQIVHVMFLPLLASLSPAVIQRPCIHSPKQELFKYSFRLKSQLSLIHIEFEFCGDEGEGVISDSMVLNLNIHSKWHLLIIDLWKFTDFVHDAKQGHLNLCQLSEISCCTYLLDGKSQWV